jgi:hypothetical protein
MAAGVVTAAAIATDAIDADAIAASAVTEIQAGLATAAALATVQSDTDDIQTRLPVALVGGRMDASLGAIQVGVDLSATMKASVNAEVVDGLATDTYVEPTGVPADTVSMQEKLGRLYQALIKGLVVDANTNKLQFKNAAGTVIWEKDLTDAGNIYTESAGNAP